MRIIAAAGEFVLPAGFKAERTLYNLLLSDQGEQTAPITLPNDDGGVNMRLIGYSGNLDSYYKPLKELDVIVQDGLIVRSCTLGINSAVSDISATIYLASGDFFSKIDEKKLANLAWPTFTSPYVSATLADKVSYLVNKLKVEYLNPTANAEFMIAPIATTQKYTFRVWEIHSGGSYTSADQESILVLNAFSKYIVKTLSSSTATKLDKWEGEHTQTVIDGDAVISLSTGYGITPFLRLDYILKFIFSSFGYTLDMSSVSAITDLNYNSIVLTNNVADAIYSGTLKYKQLVPDVTIKAFIDCIHKLFAGRFIFDEIYKVAKFIRFEEVLPKSVNYGNNVEYPALPDIDLTPYLCAPVKLSTPEFTQVRLIDSSITEKELDKGDISIETISFPIIKRSIINDSFNAQVGTTYGVANFNLPMATIGDVVHLNTGVVLDGVLTESTDSASGEIQFMNISAEFMPSSCSFNGADYDLTSRKSFILFDEYGVSTGTLDKIKSHYTSYQDFRLNSNIPTEPVDMVIPETILSKLKLHIPKIIYGQPVMIEKIVQNMGEDNTQSGTQKVTFRTIRAFANR